MRYQLVIFDLDGTLVDTLPSIAAALNYGLQQAGARPLPEHVVRGLVGEGVKRLVEKSLALQPGTTASVEAVLAGLKPYYAAHASDGSRPYPGIPEALARLQAEPQRRMSVLTNKPGNLARALIADLGFAQFFDAVIGDFDGHPCKPDPSAARSLMARFDVSAERTVMVGDGIPDLELAHALGCASAAASWGYTERERLVGLGPTHVLESAAELEGYC